MAFWSSETLRERIVADALITPYQESQVTHCAYELRMGPEVFITSGEDKTKSVLEEGESIVIPSGQFALLLTEAEVRVPSDAIGFISMRFGVKRQGLINVSGFHVDPGFEGRLKFSVYNAGSRDITLSRGDRVFVIWYASLDGHTEDSYKNFDPGQNRITSGDQNIMHGEIASPGQLKNDLDSLKHKFENLKWVVGVLVALAAAILLRWVSTDMNRLKEEVKKEVKKEVGQELLSELNAASEKTTPTPETNGMGEGSRDAPVPTPAGENTAN